MENKKEKKVTRKQKSCKEKIDNFSIIRNKDKKKIG